MNEHTCLVCGYSEDAEFYPRDYHICDCCGTEFGFDDRVLSHEQLRNDWIAKDYPWFYGTLPPGWDPHLQLLDAGLIKQNTALGATNRLVATIVVPSVPPFRSVRLVHRSPDQPATPITDNTVREGDLVGVS